MRHPLYLIALCALLSTACSDRPEIVEVQGHRTQATLPHKPLTETAFINTSSLQSINEVAIGDLRRAQEYTNIDYAMVLLDQLPEGYSAETAAAELFEQWQVGREQNGRGVLYLFVEADGVLKIEVGYELEDVFPDAFIASFQETLKDYYRGEYFGDVVSSMIITMMRRARGEAAQAMMEEFQGGLPAINSTHTAAYLSGGAGVTESNFIKNRTDRLRNVKPLNDKERAHYTKDANIETVLQRYLESLKKGINDPYLPLLTEGSQFMRMEYPKSASLQRNAYRDFSGSYTIHESGDYAAVRFERPEVMPILLRKDTEGDWLADITKSWAYSQASRGLKQMNPAYRDHAWIFAWEPEFHEAEVPRTPIPFPNGQSLAGAIARLEQAIATTPEDAENYFQLADIFFYECYWIRDAMKLIETGLQYAPDNCLYRERYITFAYRFPDLSQVLKHREEIYQRNPGDFKNLSYYRAYLRSRKPKNYQEKVQELEDADEKKPIPLFEFPLNANPAKFKRHSFHFDQPTQQLEATYQFVAPHWHDKYTPAIKVYLDDKDNEEEFGVMLIQETPDGPITAHPIATSTHTFTPFSFPNTTPATLRFKWTPKKDFELSINSHTVLTMPSKMNPQRVIIYQRSSSSIVKLHAE